MWEMAGIYELWEGLVWQLHCIDREIGLGGALCLAFARCHCGRPLWRLAQTIVGPDLLFPPLFSGHMVPAWPLTTSDSLQAWVSPRPLYPFIGFWEGCPSACRGQRQNTGTDQVSATCCLT